MKKRLDSLVWFSWDGELIDGNVYIDRDGKELFLCCSGMVGDDYHFLDANHYDNPVFISADKVRDWIVDERR